MVPGRRRVLYAAVLLVAIATHFVRLAERPLHHDESIHAFQSYTLSKDGTWRYDPAYHGPFLYYANAAVYKVFGASNFTARILPAAFGVGLLLFAFPLASWLGSGAAAAYVILVLASPHLTYFSRFIREDLYSLVFTFGTIVAFRRFLETDRSRWLTLSAVSFALAGTTKENAYMTGVLFVVFGVWLFLEAALAQPGGFPRSARAVSQWVAPRFVPIVIAATVFLCIWALLYTAFGRYPGDWLAIPKAIKYWIGQHSIARIPGPWYYYFPQLLMYETATLVAALLVLRRPDIRRDRFIQSVACALGGLAFAALASSVLGETSASRWAFRAIAFLSVVAAVDRLRIPAAQAKQAAQAKEAASSERAAPMLRFIVYWALASLAIYGWAREKVPWLTVHPLLPITILAAIAMADLWQDRRRAGAKLGLAVVVLLLAVNATGMYLASFRYGAHDVAREPNHAEMLAYVQTSHDLVRALAAVDRAKARVPEGQPVITVSGEASWPLTWYLRNVITQWPTRIDVAATPILVSDWDPKGGLEKQLADTYTATRVPIRAWWFPGRVKEEGKPERPTPGDVLNYWLFHRIWSPIGSQDATFFVRKDLDSGTGPLTPLNIRLQDPTSRDYNGAAALLEPLKVIGGPGTGNGEFTEPRGVAVDGRGTLYVADTKNSRVQVFDGTGQFVRQFGSKGPAPTQFNEPCGLAVDAMGELWVADTWNQRIVHYTQDGRMVGMIGPENGFFGPRAVVVSRGFIYVADTGNKKIVRFDRDGKRMNEFGGEGSGPGQLVEPVGVAADASGNVYVADTGNHRVQVFDGEGKFLRQFPVAGWMDFYTEPYIAVGPGDTVIVTDAWGGRVAAYDPKGVMRRSWKADKDFKQPTGIAVDPYGRLIVSDRGTNRVFSWALTAVLP